MKFSFQHDPRYKAWCASVGILPDSEGGECWDYQQQIIDKLNEELAELRPKTETNSGEKIFRTGDLEAAANGSYVPHLTDRYEISYLED